MQVFLMQQIISALLACANKVRRYGDHFHPDLTLNQWMILLAVAHLDKSGSPLEDISCMLGITPGKVRCRALRLEEKGFVQLEELEHATLVAFTQTGAEACTGFLDSSASVLLDASRAFTPEELDFFWECLRRLYAFDGEKLIGLEQRSLKR